MKNEMLSIGQSFKFNNTFALSSRLVRTNEKFGYKIKKGAITWMVSRGKPEKLVSIRIAFLERTASTAWPVVHRDVAHGSIQSNHVDIAFSLALISVIVVIQVQQDKLGIQTTGVIPQSFLVSDRTSPYFWSLAYPAVLEGTFQNVRSGKWLFPNLNFAAAKSYQPLASDGRSNAEGAANYTTFVVAHATDWSWGNDNCSVFLTKHQFVISKNSVVIWPLWRLRMKEFFQISSLIAGIINVVEFFPEIIAN